jgi:hypothetical protein
LFKKISAADFVRSLDPIALLGTANKIVFDTDEEKEYRIPFCTLTAKLIFLEIDG